MTFLDPRVTPIVALLALGGGLLLLIRKAMKVETHIIDEEGIQVAWRRDTADGAPPLRAAVYRKGTVR
jgi:hypothetical protein